MTVLEEIFVTTRIIAFERYTFICRKQKKAESLELFHADLVELASRADCDDRESEWVRDMFTAHMNNEKIAEELLAQTRSPQEAYEYAIRREKKIENSRTMKINAIGGQTVTTKQEPVHYVNTRGRQNQQYNQNNQRGRGGFRGLRIHVDHKTQEVNSINNNETQSQDNVVSVGINMVRTIYNHVWRKTKFARNAQNADTSQKFAVLQT